MILCWKFSKQYGNQLYHVISTDFDALLSLSRFRRQADQQLRQDQDQAYEESLAADREKERIRMEAQQRVETEARQHREKEIKEEKRKEVRYAMLWDCSCLQF